MRNTVALMLSQYGALACNLAFSIWLTRLLSPSDYGLIASSLFVLAALDCLCEFGWDEALLSCKDLSFHRAASTHLWVRVVLGSVPLLLVYAAGQRLGAMQPVLLLLAGSWWLEKIACTFKAATTRAHQLHKLAGVEFVLSVSSFVIAIVAALHGLGVYALVLQRFVSQGLLAVGYYLVSPWRGGWVFDPAIVRTFLQRFGAASWLSALAKLPLVDFMPFVIGLLCSSHDAGLYAKAFTMGTFPMMLSGISERVTIPLYTDAQGDARKLKKIFTQTQALKALVLLPGQLLLVTTAAWWVPMLLGSTWQVVVPIYQVMALYGLCRSFYEDVPPLFIYGMRNPWEQLRLRLWQALFITLLGPLGVLAWGVQGGAAAMAVMALGGVVVLWRRVSFALALRRHDFVESMKYRAFFRE